MTSSFKRYVQLVDEMPDDVCAAAFDGWYEEYGMYTAEEFPEEVCSRFRVIDRWLCTLTPEEATHDALKEAYTLCLVEKKWLQDFMKMNFPTKK